MAFTDKRIVNALALQSASLQPKSLAASTPMTSTAHGEIESGTDNTRTSRKCRGVERKQTFPENKAMPPTDDGTKALEQHPPYQPGAAHFGAILMGNAPQQLTLDELCNLLQAGTYFMASKLLKHMLQYVQPVIEQALLLNVRGSDLSCLLLSACCLTCRINLSLVVNLECPAATVAS